MIADKSSVLWRCRRGIREMDLLLQRFIEQRYDGLSADEKATFATLLEQPDLDIMDWLMGRIAPPAAFRPIIDLLRATNVTQNAGDIK